MFIVFMRVYVSLAFAMGARMCLCHLNLQLAHPASGVATAPSWMGGPLRTADYVSPQQSLLQGLHTITLPGAS